MKEMESKGESYGGAFSFIRFIPFNRIAIFASVSFSGQACPYVGFKDFIVGEGIINPHDESFVLIPCGLAMTEGTDLVRYQGIV